VDIVTLNIFKDFTILTKLHLNLLFNLEDHSLL